MKNFFRVVQLTLKRRFTFAAALACAIGVAVLWGANLGLIKPIIDIVFTDKQPHAWADSKVDECQEKIDGTRKEIAQVAASVAIAPAEQRAELAIKQDHL